MRKGVSLFAAVLVAALILSSAFSAQAEGSAKKYSGTFFDVFDTIITYISFTDSEEEFTRQFDFVQAEMTRLHRVFDQYHGYDGIQNVFVLNTQAAEGAIKAEPELITLLSRVRDWREAYATAVNPAMGSVLELWHETREVTKTLPDPEALNAAAGHCRFEDVIINEEAGTIQYADPLLKLDLGAVAKGYSAQYVADELKAQGVSHFILNAGGNVVCGDAPLDGRAAWTIAVEDTDGSSMRHKVYAINRSLVTSGDYQRYVTIDGVNYHHLIDPVTLYPAVHCRAVTIICEDSGLGDFLSSAAFLMPCEDALRMIESIDNCEACWLLQDRTEVTSSGYPRYMQKP